MSNTKLHFGEYFAAFVRGRSCRRWFEFGGRVPSVTAYANAVGESTVKTRPL